MSSKVLLVTAAACVVVFGIPAGAEPQTAQPQGEAARQAEKAADEAVADARAEVVAEAQAQAEAQSGEAQTGDEAATPVTLSDVREGSTVHDTQGGVVGTIDSVDENGAVVSTGRARARLPFSSFGKNARGLVISLSRAQLEAAVAARTPS